MKHLHNSMLGRKFHFLISCLIISIFLVGLGSWFWMNNQIGIPNTFFDLSIITGFGTFAMVKERS